MGEQKHLYVCYWFRGELHEFSAGDKDAVAAPLRGMYMCLTEQATSCRIARRILNDTAILHARFPEFAYARIASLRLSSASRIFFSASTLNLK